MNKNTQKAMNLLKEAVDLNIDTIEGFKQIASTFQKQAEDINLNEFAIIAYEKIRKASSLLNYYVHRIVDAIEYERDVLLPQEAEEGKKYGKH